MTSHNEAAYAALIGIDWADQQHDYCLGVVGTQTVETGVIDARPEGVAAFINPLRKRFQGQPLALCLEQLRFLRCVGRAVVETDQAGGRAIRRQLAHELPPQIAQRAGDGDAARPLGHL